MLRQSGIRFRESPSEVTVLTTLGNRLGTNQFDTELARQTVVRVARRLGRQFASALFTEVVGEWTTSDVKCYAVPGFEMSMYKRSREKVSCDHAEQPFDSCLMITDCEGAKI